MRIFGSDRMDSILQRLGLERARPLPHPWVNKALEKSAAEGRSAQFRDPQESSENSTKRAERSAQSDLRTSVSTFMRAEEVDEIIAQMRVQVTEEMVAPPQFPERAYAEQWDSAGLEEEVRNVFGVEASGSVEWAKEEGIADEEIRERIADAVEPPPPRNGPRILGPRSWRYLEKTILLQTLDQGLGANTSFSSNICAQYVRAPGIWPGAIP